MRHRRTRETLISTPLAAEGNPATAIAIYLTLLKAGITNTELMLTTLPAIPAKIFHKSMTGSVENTDDYNQNGGRLRELTLPLLGLLTQLETSVRYPGFEFDTLVAVQEHQLGFDNPSSLNARYPKGRYLFVPDVMPKESGLKVIQRTRVTPLVWNDESHGILNNRGLNPILTAPVLPHGFIDPTYSQSDPNERVVVKASGSGIPKSYETGIQAALDDLKISYEMYLPQVVLSSGGSSRKRPASQVAKIDDYYQRLFHPLPKVVICYPSEMVQVAASLAPLGTSFLFLPPRGLHEINNLQWALNRSLGKNLIMNDSSGTRDQISQALSQKNVIDPGRLGLGTKSITEILLSR